MNAAAQAGVEDADLADEIAAGAAILDVPLTSAQVDRFVAYLRLIERWNATYNLTAIRNPRDMVAHHLLDCLAAAAALARERGTGVGKRLLDVGTGAGLPGLVIAVVSPAREVVCIDSVGKKTAFVTQAATVLGLRNVTAMHARVESVQGRVFDEIVSRAFSSLADLLSATRHLLDEAGIWMAMKAKVSEIELSNLRGVTHRVEPLRVPQLTAVRCLVWLTPEASTH